MNQIIKINDDRTNQTDNLQVEVSTAELQTFDTLDEKGEPQKITLNVIKPKETTTLGDLKKDLSNKENYLNQAKQNVTERQKDYDDTVALIAQIQGEADKLPARQVAEEVI